jgi:hypothetical protein
LNPFAHVQAATNQAGIPNSHAPPTLDQHHEQKVAAAAAAVFDIKAKRPGACHSTQKPSRDQQAPSPRTFAVKPATTAPASAVTAQLHPKLPPQLLCSYHPYPWLIFKRAKH